MNEQQNRIHFIGIGGIGVSALAQLAQAQGVPVSGSDPNANPASNPAIARLIAGGATTYTLHRKENLAQDVRTVVASAAIPEDNPEMQEAKARGLRIVSRAEYLGELMAAHPGVKIAVAGTHGKTTTTGMIGVLLQSIGMNPTVFVGGEVAQLGGNLRIGSPQDPFVAEACEAYDSFLHLKPDISILTNIEADHLDHYGSYENVLKGFRKFLENTKYTVIGCVDSQGVHDALKGIECPAFRFIRYSLYTENSDSRATNVQLSQTPLFDWRYGVSGVYPLKLQVPGEHNIQNAIAAATLASTLDAEPKQIAEGLYAFLGAGRRQEVLGDFEYGAGTVRIMDDYAHHPTELRATLDALRGAYPNRRLIAVFQPHLYSRTRDFLEGFAATLATADLLCVTDIYAAREAPIEGVRSADIVNLAVEKNRGLPAIYLPDKRDIPRMLLGLMHPDDLVVFLGAGDIREQAVALSQLLKQ